MKIRFTFVAEINDSHPIFDCDEITPEWQAAALETIREFVESVRDHIEKQPLIVGCKVIEEEEE